MSRRTNPALAAGPSGSTELMNTPTEPGKPIEAAASGGRSSTSMPRLRWASLRPVGMGFCARVSLAWMGFAVAADADGLTPGSVADQLQADVVARLAADERDGEIDALGDGLVIHAAQDVAWQDARAAPPASRAGRCDARRIKGVERQAADDAVAAFDVQKVWQHFAKLIDGMAKPMFWASPRMRCSRR